MSNLRALGGGKKQLLLLALDHYEKDSPFVMASVGMRQDNLDLLQKYFDTTKKCLENSNISSMCFFLGIAYPVQMPKHVGMENLRHLLNTEDQGFTYTSDTISTLTNEFPSELEVSIDRFRFILHYSAREYRTVWMPQSDLTI